MTYQLNLGGTTFFRPVPHSVFRWPFFRHLSALLLPLQPLFHPGQASLKQLKLAGSIGLLKAKGPGFSMFFLGDNRW